MKETSYQSKIMKGLESMGGKAINGVYTKTGEADIQGGYPANDILYYIAIEVKTEYDYHRVMSALRLEDDNTYTIIDRVKLKDHEPMQVHKMNDIRLRNGLSLFAFELQQVIDYAEKEIA